MASSIVLVVLDNLENWQRRRLVRRHQSCSMEGWRYSKARGCQAIGDDHGWSGGGLWRIVGGR